MKAAKKCLSALVAAAMLMTLTGCWDLRNLNRTAIVLALGLDRDDGHPDLIRLTVAAALPREVAGGKEGSQTSSGGPPAFVYSESGRTLFEALRKMSQITSRRLFFAHNQVLIIGEALAKEGVDTLFDLMDRDSEVRNDFDVLIARNQKAADILQTMTLFEKIPNQEIYNIIKTQEEALGLSYKVSAKTFIDDLVSDKKMPIAGSIEIAGDISQARKLSNVATMKPSAILRLGPMAVFNKGKLAGYLNDKESRGLSFEQNKVKATLITVSCGKEESASVEILKSKTEVKADISGGKPTLTINVKQKAAVGESRCTNFDISKKESIQVLEQKTEAQVRNEIQSALGKMQDRLKIDGFGFGEAVYKASPGYWKENQKRWNEIFPSISVNIKVKTEISGAGIRGKSYLQQQTGGKPS